MQDVLERILAITGAAESIPRSYFRQALQVDAKHDASPVTIADRETEKAIRTAISEDFPDHAIFGEEFGRSDGESSWLWIIDPIDGTRSFISGMPLYGMLVGLLKDGKPVLGVVRMPELGEAYAGDGNAATMNGGILAVSHAARLEDAFVYVNEADKLLRDEPDVFARLNAVGRDRRYGYDCYPHMLVAAGHADACVDYDLKPYDFLPLVPVIEGAGGVITDWAGNRLGLGSGGRVVSAATPDLHRQLLDVLNRG